MQRPDSEFLLRKLRQYATLPEIETRFGNDGLIEFINDRLSNYIVPAIRTVNEDYFIEWDDTFIENSQQNEFEIPSGAVNGTILSVSVWDQYKKYMVYSFERISYPGIDMIGYGFFIKDNTIILYPQSNNYGTCYLRIAYVKRPLQICTPENYRKIISIDSPTQFTLDSAPPVSWVADFILTGTSKNSPHKTIEGFEEFAIVGVVGSQVTVASTNGLSQGDYVAPEGETAFAQIPDDMVSWLLQASNMKVMESLGDQEGMTIASLDMQKMESMVIRNITPRATGSPKKVSSNKGIYRWI